MPAKKKSSMVTMPKSWLIAAVLVLGTVVVAQAVNSNKQQVNVNEVKSSGVEEGSYTGTVSREVAMVNGKDHERYFLTADGGTKYMLIGLKTGGTSVQKESKALQSPQGAPVKGQGQGNSNANKEAKNNQQANNTPKSSPKADAEDVGVFEEFVGKKVTIVGMVVPVGSDNQPKASRAPAASMMPKADKTGNSGNPEKSPNGNAGQNPNKPDMGNGSQRPDKPMASAAVRSPKPDSGETGTPWEYARLVVKSVTLVQ